MGKSWIKSIVYYAIMKEGPLVHTQSFVGPGAPPSENS